MLSTCISIELLQSIGQVFAKMSEIEKVASVQ